MIHLLWILYIIVLIPLHELGHYLIARKFGWNASIIFSRKYVLGALGVQVGNVEIDIENPKDVVRFHYQFSAFALFGFFFPAILALIFNYFAPFSFLYEMLLILLLYSVLEIFTGFDEVKKV